MKSLTDTNQSSTSPEQQLALVGRQSIYKPDLDVYGYELLYRPVSGQNSVPSEFDGNHATTQVMLNAFFEIGLENVVSDKTAFINLTDSFISGEINIPHTQKKLVLEVLETVEPTPEVLDGLKKLKQQGFIIALDDFDFSENAKPFLNLADIVKVDLMLLDHHTLESNIDILKTEFKPTLLAEKVETQEDFDLCKSLGFNLFQGYFLQKPVIITGKKLPANKVAILQILQKLQEPNIEIDELQSLIKNDVSLSYKVLRYINSPAFSLNSEISSIKQAILLLGLNTLKRWVSLIVLAGLSDKSQDLIRTALVRAKMSELLATEFKNENSEEYFLLGLFSMLDAMLDQPLEDIIASIPLKQELKDGLIRRKGNMGVMLSNVIQYERGEWDALILDEAHAKIYRDSYLESIEWAEKSLVGMQ